MSGVSDEIKSQLHGVVAEFSVSFEKTSQPYVTTTDTLNTDSPSSFAHYPTNGSFAVEIDKAYFSDETVEFVYTINLAVICTGLCVFGITANIINIVVFVKQGFRESINITLFALAVSDLASLISLLWMGICANPYFKYANTPLLTVEVSDITGGWIHVLFCRITGWLTALVTLERCLCVLLPLKIKALLTPSRIQALILAIFLLVTAGMAPIFYSTNLRWRFVPERNATLLGLAYSQNWPQMMEASALVSGVVSTLGFSSIVMVSTLVLVVELKAKSRWRQKVTVVASEKSNSKKPTASNDNKSYSSDDKTNSASNNNSKGRTAGIQRPGTSKERRTVQMVIVIAVIFIVCLLPSSMISIPLALVPEFSLMGRYGNLLMVVISFSMILEALNSSTNILVYYTMSSNYRAVFRSLFVKDKE